MRSAYKVLPGNPERKKDVEWINLVQDRFQWQALTSNRN
jgi:hypothetical protein